MKPKQYDIIVYSTYGSTLDTNTNRTKTSSTQTLLNNLNNIASRLEDMKFDNKTVAGKGKNWKKKIVKKELLSK